MEAKASRTSQYINDLTTVGAFKALVEAIRKARPVLRLGIACGHTETSTYTDSNGNTQTSKKFVETYRASEDFDNGGQVAEGDALLVCQWCRALIGLVVSCQSDVTRLFYPSISTSLRRPATPKWYSSYLYLSAGHI